MQRHPYCKDPEQKEISKKENVCTESPLASVTSSTRKISKYTRHYAAVTAHYTATTIEESKILKVGTAAIKNPIYRTQLKAQ